MKILLVSTLYPPYAIGGAEKAAALLAEALVRSGYEVVVVSLHDGLTEDIETLNGVRVYRIPLDNFYWPFGHKRMPSKLSRLAWHLRDMWNTKAVSRISRILDIESPDVVHTHNISGFSVAVWREVKRRKIRLVHTLHDYYLLCSRYTLFHDGKICKKRCLRCLALTFNTKALSRLPDAVVSVSQYTLDEHVRRNYFKGVQRAVIYNVSDVEGVAMRSHLERKGAASDLVFGFIGRIEKEKGIETLLEATKALQIANWRLKVAGTGLAEYVAELKGRFADRRIEWLGFVDSAGFYASVDVVVLSSEWHEPLSYVCMEAIHAGKALICTLSGGIPEIARLGKLVKYFPAGDAHALSERMKEALENPLQWSGDAGGDASALDVFQWRNVVAMHLLEYNIEQAKAL